MGKYFKDHYNDNETTDTSIVIKPSEQWENIWHSQTWIGFVMFTANIFFFFGQGFDFVAK